MLVLSTLLALLAGAAGLPQLEILLCRCNEDVSWVDQLGYSDVTTVHSKCGARRALPYEVRTANVGREGGTFLKHIVDRYDTLADWTVFTQGEKPSYGYLGHRQGGGHMMSTAKFQDYVDGVKSMEDRPRFFVFSGATLLQEDGNLAQAVRKGYGEPYVGSNESPSSCGDITEYGTWYAFPSWFKNMVVELQKRQGAPFVGFSSTEVFRLFDVFPASNVVMFSQGSRFAASRAAIQSRPVAYYQKLLSLMNSEDPWAGYLLEFLWWYVIGGDSAPCGFEEDIAQTYTVSKMKLQLAIVQQVSGISGSSAISAWDESSILALTDAQRVALFVNVATTSGVVVIMENNENGGFVFMLFVPQAGDVHVVTGGITKDGNGGSTVLSLVPCLSSADTSACEEASAIWSQCAIKPTGIAALGGKCPGSAFLGCSIVRMRKDGSIIKTKLTVIMLPCPSSAKSGAVDGSYCEDGSIGNLKSDLSCNVEMPSTSVLTGYAASSNSTGPAGSNTGLFYIIFVLMIIPIALLVAGLFYYYFYHYKPARESEQYLAPCCAAPGYAYPPQMLTNTPALPVGYI